ncbi:NAD(P)-dependent oxidoreductase [Cryptosporangium sp. NPDC051539]|uniref:NAD(P)-dependent oxidoreductase n=1 Tax=Cryptosporangium sp. NPDC051539 TaxID=3363962 RepID=UPI0037B73806
MKLVVMGATGGIGREVVRQALKDGDQVTALVRNPLDLEHPALEVVRVDVLDPAALAPAIAGHDAVISALGHRGGGPATVCADGARALVAGAGDVGLRRVLLVSASGAYVEPSDDVVTRRLVKPMLGRFLRRSFDDTREMEALVRASDLDWTLVRPPRLTNGPHTGRYRTGVDGVRRGYRVARADVADALLALIPQRGSIRRALTVAG